MEFFDERIGTFDPSGPGSSLVQARISSFQRDDVLYMTGCYVCLVSKIFNSKSMSRKRIPEICSKAYGCNAKELKPEQRKQRNIIRPIWINQDASCGVASKKRENTPFSKIAFTKTETSVWKTKFVKFVSEKFDTVQSQPTKCFALVAWFVSEQLCPGKLCEERETPESISSIVYHL